MENAGPGAHPPAGNMLKGFMGELPGGEESQETDQTASQNQVADDLCLVCQTIKFVELFETGKRSPDVDGDWLKRVNTTQNVRIQNSCPFCRILLQIISSNSFTSKCENNITAPDDGIYMEPMRADHALCGAKVERGVSEHDSAVASCLHVETATKRFHDKIVLVPGSDETARRYLYSMPVSLDSEVNYHVLNRQIYNCELSHKEGGCGSSPRQLDSRQFKHRQRVIDIQSRRIVQVDLASVKYAALTYVWGASQSHQAKSGEAHPGWLVHYRHKASRILPDVLPKTFEDAMIACAGLGIAYLWIDMFCIDQQDEEDKRIQIGHMDAIFDAAFLTMVAVEGADPSAGLPRVSSPMRASPTPRTLPTENINGLHLGILPGFKIPDTVWNTRAWTLQETLLSKRLLVFNKNYVSFFCRGGVEREDLHHFGGPNSNEFSRWRGHPGSPFTKEYCDSEFEMSRYCELAHLYCSRKMTDPMDALNAVSGLLKVWSRSNNLDFVAGLPSSRLTDGLIWYGSDYKLRGHPSLPSWCWTAWQGSLWYHAVTNECTGESLKEIKSKYKIEPANFANKLSSRLISWVEPETIRSGTFIEQEALVNVSRTFPEKPQLTITSYFARFQLTIISLEAYQMRDFKQDWLNHTANSQNSVFMVKEPNGVSIRFAKHAGKYRLNLPKDMNSLQEQKLRDEKVEFIMLKKWFHLNRSVDQEIFLIWALLISREGNFARRLGCIAIPPKIWDLGSPRIETVILE